MSKEAKYEEYIESLGTECLFCNHEDLKRGTFEYDDGQTWQKVECSKYGGVWNDFFLLQSSYVLKEPND